MTEYPHLKGKLCEVLTDAIRIARLKMNGYSVIAPELTDPENTPKNTLIRAVKKKNPSKEEICAAEKRYEECLDFVLGEGKKNYLKDF